jgi:hypothetical protein
VSAAVILADLLVAVVTGPSPARAAILGPGRSWLYAFPIEQALGRSRVRVVGP